ncbi:unnamed protein product, partial [marine sediment metagenome]
LVSIERLKKFRDASRNAARKAKEEIEREEKEKESRRRPS